MLKLNFLILLLFALRVHSEEAPKEEEEEVKTKDQLWKESIVSVDKMWDYFHEDHTFTNASDNVTDDASSRIRKIMELTFKMSYFDITTYKTMDFQKKKAENQATKDPMENYYKSFVKFGYLMSMYINDPKRLEEIKLTPEVHTFLADNFDQQYIEMMKSFSNVSQYIALHNEQYNLHNEFDVLWHAYTTFWLRLDKAAKDNLLEKCELARPMRILLALKSFVHDTVSGYIPQLKKYLHVPTTMDNILFFVEKLLSLTVQMRAFCNGVEQKHVKINGIYGILAEIQVEIVEMVLDGRKDEHILFWNDRTHGIERFVCNIIENNTQLDYYHLAEKLVTSMQTTFTDYYGEGNFAAIIGKSTKNPNHNADHNLVQTFKNKLRPIVLDRNIFTDSHFFLGHDLCPESKEYDILVLRDDHGLDSTDVNEKELDLHFNKTEIIFSLHHVDSAIGWTFGHASDYVRFWIDGEEKVRKGDVPDPFCIYHYIRRGNKSIAMAYEHKLHKLSYYNHHFVVNLGSDKNPIHEHFQIISIC